MFVLLLLFGLFYGTYNISAYDLNQATISVYLSGAAYCGKDHYKSMVLSGSATGFVYEDTLYDIAADLQGYIGYLPSTKSIYVALRGSSSAMNWLDDAEIKLVDYTTYPECNCKVHYGFYRSIQGIINKTISTVAILQKRFPFYTVILTGHSYGASIIGHGTRQSQYNGGNIQFRPAPGRRSPLRRIYK
jgi:triacylglycerol lipase